ncbi:MAG: FtsB family cell division protein [Desulfomonilaceae bacterium]
MNFLKIGFAITMILVTMLYLQEQGNIEKSSLKMKTSKLRLENSQLEYEINSLSKKISKLRTNPKAIEKVANRKLGMVRQDETIYIFDSFRDKK